MIVGNTVIATLTEDSEHKYYLTGSRYFGTHTIKSDYDFFVQYDPSIEEKLRGDGWEQEFSQSYIDPIAMSCWIKENVHLQIVSDAQLKFQVQKFLMESDLIFKFGENKLVKRAIWTTAIMVFKKFKEQKNESETT